MRKTRVLLLLILVAVGVHFVIYGHRMGWFGPAGQDAGAPAAGGAESGKVDAIRPSFDIVRAEPSGEIVMAGRAEPGWTVSVESNGELVGTAKADANGEWIIQPKTPIARGEHSLELKAQDPAGGHTVFSKQRIALSLSETGKDRPLVAMTEEGKATRVLQMPPQTAQEPLSEGTAAIRPAARAETPAEAATDVTFSALDYEEAGPKSMLHMTGRAAPGARLMLYIDNDFAGSTTADATGKWTFSGNREMEGGGHDIRADMVDAELGKVLVRAEVKFDREPRRTAASPEDKTDEPVASAAVTGSTGALKNEARRYAKRRENRWTWSDGHTVIVRRGDTLWQIARRYYGNGAQYTQIFRNNRDQIRDPDLIYPHQRFSLPER